MSADIKIDVSRAKSAAVGKDHGVAPQELRDLIPRLIEIKQTLDAERRDGKYGFWDLYKADEVFSDVRSTAESFLQRGYENLVILGIGGSALGTTALATALLPPFYNMLTRRQRQNRPRIFVMDNIDPVSFRQMMRLCPPQKTLYNVISKSGGTAETMSQLLIVVEQIQKKVGMEALAEHVVVTTNPRTPDAPPSHLHPVADEFGCKEFNVPLNVGGRFSVFSPVGMFPAALLGMDIDAMREGCASMDARCGSEDMEANPAYLRAAFQYLACTQKGKVMSVMMPYADALRDVADWYRQLWAESLGKKESLSGQDVYAGQTPVKALGATDQHSQVQLYREGPNDKIFNILEVSRFDKTIRIPETLPQLTALDYLRGSSMNKLMSAELRGTMDALKLSERPVLRTALSRVDAHSVAQLLYMLEVETAVSGRLYNVDAFNQPGVEEGKKLARKLMGGEG